MAGKFLFDIANYLSTALREDLQQGLDLARNQQILIDATADGFSDATTHIGTRHTATGKAGVYERTARISRQVEIASNIAPDRTRDRVQGSVPPNSSCDEAPKKTHELQAVPQTLSPQDILAKTMGDLMKCDIEMAAVCLEEFNNDEISNGAQEQAVCSAKQICALLASGNPTIAKARQVVRASENLAAQILEIEIGPSSRMEPIATEMGVAKLHAGKLLTQNIRKSLQDLLTALVQQLGCCDEKHFLRLRLTGFLDLIDRQSQSSFDLYLSTGHDCERSYWVESRCTFTKKLVHREQTGCKFIKDSLDGGHIMRVLLETQSRHSRMQSTTNTEKPLVALGSIQLEETEEYQSSLTPTASIAGLMRPEESSSKIRPVSNAGSFKTKERDRLCFNIALSLLHLSAGDWRKVVWYSNFPKTEGIFFLRDPSTQKIVERTQPYISWRLCKSGITRRIDGLQCDPQLLDFARLLIEIYSWKKLESTHNGPVNEALRLDLLTYIDENFRLRSESDFISALKACLNDAGRIEAAAEDKPERLQTYIFEKIVKPLYQHFGSPDLSESSALAIIACDDLNRTRQRNAKSIYDLRVDYDGPVEERRYEKKFWTETFKFTKKYITCLPNSATFHGGGPYPDRKVRVAVIDSGVRQEDPEIASSDQIRDSRNFISGSDLRNCEDQVGHGTMIARLLMKVAPEAEIYIAKVSDQDTMPKSQLHRIAEAIKWAVLQWDVDIISISLALYEEHYDINEELTEALSPTSRYAKRKIVFAAAGNRGVYKPPAWPASKEQVIAIYATDGSGAGTKANPSPGESINLATLGENIKMRCPDPERLGEFKDAYISGSSFATPIAAGIAANVLEFARHQCNLTEWKRDQFYSHDGMMKILNEMSCRRGDYDFIHPLNMWNEAFSGRWRGKLQRDLNLERNNPSNICKVLDSII